MLPFKGNKKITSQSTLKQLPMLKINGKQWGNGNIQFGSSLRGSFGNYEKKAQRNFCINQKAERERERERDRVLTLHTLTQRDLNLVGGKVQFFLPWNLSLSLSRNILFLESLSFASINPIGFSLSAFLLSLTFSPLLFLSHWFIKQNFIFFVHFVNTHLDLEAKGERACEVGVSHGSSSSKTRWDKPPSNGPTSRLGILYWLKPILGYGQSSFLFTIPFLQSLIY